MAEVPLETLVGLLRAFTRRHRNQHHASPWWAAMAMLRRALVALVADGPPARRQARARWLRRQLIPRAYIAFSQLAADNQHAPLGIFLLVVLARAASLLDQLAPPRTGTSSSETPAPPPPLPPSTADLDSDRGIALARSHASATLDDQVEPRLDEPPMPPREAKQSMTKIETRQPKTRPKKKKDKAKADDAFATLFSSLS